ncbi:MAG: sigma-54-dependent Fis family transcriptional regulator [Acidobacteria bacterium]|nr:MAG: sigma-54-dependent Fis family transcriptional regulator [Acidobacteriota bacterium]
MEQDKQHLLIVEDEGALRCALAESLSAEGFEVSEADGAVSALQALDEFAYDGLVVDLHLPDGRGMKVLDRALEQYPLIAAVVVTGYGQVEDAVAAMKRGAIEFLQKPFRTAALAGAFRNEFERRRRRRAEGFRAPRPAAAGGVDGIVGVGPAMTRVFHTLSRIAPLAGTVLIQGETGTGKELIARTLHQRSPRAEERFVAFSAAAIPEPLAEAELFGHTRGAFTGAVSARVGRFELAHRGTLFIDEVESMPLPLQAKLLRALQQREIERVGESRPIKFDARVVAASNVDLRKLVKEGTFREDLYYRLNVLRVTLPPLRERREDIAELAKHFVEKSCRLNNLPVKQLGQDAVRALMAYRWPGNIRQLENAIEHAVAMSEGSGEIRVADLPPEILEADLGSLLPMVTIPDEGLSFTSTVSQLERELILRCLEKTGGNKRQAARLLQLSRTTFIDKLQRLNVDHDASAA